MVLMLVVAAGLLMQTPAAQTPAAPQGTAVDTAKRAGERIRALQREAEELVARERTLLTELRKLEVDRQLRGEELAKYEREAAETERRLALTANRLDQLKRTAEQQRPDVEARLVQLYKLGSGGYWKLLLDVDDLRAVGRAYRTASAMTTLDKERVLQHQQTLDAVATERTMLHTRAVELQGLRDQARQARAAVERALASRNALVTSIDRTAGSERAIGRRAAERATAPAVVGGQTPGRRGGAAHQTIPRRPAVARPRRGFATLRQAAEQPIRDDNRAQRHGVRDP